MRKWCAVFDDARQKEEVVDEAERDEGMLKRFDAAAKTKFAMWIEDTSTEQGDVLRVCGHCPIEIRVRHEAWKKGNKGR